MFLSLRYLTNGTSGIDSMKALALIGFSSHSAGSRPNITRTVTFKKTELIAPNQTDLSAPQFFN